MKQAFRLAAALGLVGGLMFGTVAANAQSWHARGHLHYYHSGFDYSGPAHNEMVQTPGT
jgi:hypothetical protein